MHVTPKILFLKQCEVLEGTFALPARQMIISGGFRHSTSTQRDLQYVMSIVNATTDRKKYFGQDFAIFGWKVLLHRQETTT